MKSLSLSPFLLSALLAASDAPLHRYEQSRVSMACEYAIVAHGPDPAALPGIVESALDEVDRIDRLMSHYKPDSPLSRLNREAAAGPVAVPPELYDFIEESLRYARESDGAFDITVGPLMKAWGFFRSGGRVPGEAELAEVLAKVGHRHVQLDPKARTIRFDRVGVELDLGGIAKGYAVDRVAALLRRQGVEAALISAGGSTVYGLGAPPGEDAWPVEIQDPLDPERVALTARLRDRALSMSGTSEKSFEKDGVTYTHVMDPRRGRPVQGVLGVAVLADSGTAGDALDNAFFVQGVEGGRAALARLPASVEALLFLPEPGRRWRMVRLHGLTSPPSVRRPRTAPAAGR